ncbi:uroporphyrinogen decarboxylase (URO-D) [Cuneatibacter sp. NSJ-177]|uniref:uroporphyrinogen decarboxylase family protein n=1 Tax=Cuneatibacter sp. NSJ-177 TaxID=2931401 RepID=UPI001FD5768D|nr:uroporphyrinogen decarboxylase family protein [Cuneatibacter sp. NSJ-177]MCJ7837154.1 uroporphyrinogen decarboxylase (URO-D) [Cuneatibacter sp. NSJ-177]
MLTAKENLMELLKKDGQPDRLLKQFEAFDVVLTDPINQFCRGNRKRGMTTYDKWGTCILFPEDAPGPMPHVTPENKVCPDVTEWRDTVKVPDLIANCSEGWEPAVKLAEEIREKGQISMGFMGTGIFEQCHYLMGFEDALVNLLAEPDDMHELVDAIAEYRFTYAKLLVDHLHPDAILSHDDWGSKTSLFMSPEIWREYFKEHYRRIYGYMKDHGVIVIHHADSYCEPIVEDMAEIGIDIWQGVLPSNDIPAIQKKLQGRMVLMGGIDAAVVDRADSTEEEIRAEVRRACESYGPGGHFIPCLTYGLKDSGIYPNVDATIEDEIDRYNQQNAKE